MSKPEILILGAGGFIGKKLSFYLTSQGLKGKLILVAPFPINEPFLEKESIHNLDLHQTEALSKLIAEYLPPIIFNLSGKLFSANPHELYHKNTLGPINLLEVIKDRIARQGEYNPQIIQVGSGAEYGETPNLPIVETEPLRPVDHYGISKAAASQSPLENLQLTPPQKR